MCYRALHGASRAQSQLQSFVLPLASDCNTQKWHSTNTPNKVCVVSWIRKFSQVLSHEKLQLSLQWQPGKKPTLQRHADRALNWPAKGDCSRSSWAVSCPRLLCLVQAPLEAEVRQLSSSPPALAALTSRHNARIISSKWADSTPKYPKLSVSALVNPSILFKKGQLKQSKAKLTQDVHTQPGVCVQFPSQYQEVQFEWSLKKSSYQIPPIPRG